MSFIQKTWNKVTPLLQPTEKISGQSRFHRIEKPVLYSPDGEVREATDTENLMARQQFMNRALWDVVLLTSEGDYEYCEIDTGVYPDFVDDATVLVSGVSREVAVQAIEMWNDGVELEAVIGTINQELKKRQTEAELERVLD